MSEIKPTPGPLEAERINNSNCFDIKCECGFFIATCHDGVRSESNAEANARLIAEEAGTVFHNTGLSPVQLVEMMKELKAALNLWLGTADNPNAGWRGAGGSDVLFACEHCGKKHEDCTRLEHACDCPITLARAALAKCEGVKP